MESTGQYWHSLGDSGGMQHRTNKAVTVGIKGVGTGRAVFSQGPSPRKARQENERVRMTMTHTMP